MKHDSKVRFLKNFPLGVIIGAVFSFGVAALLEKSVATQANFAVIQLLTVLATLGAAAISLIGVFAAIENQSILKKTERVGQFEADRAFLSQSLSQLCALCSRGMDYNIRYSSSAECRNDFSETSISQLAIDPETIKLIRSLLRNCDDPIVTDRLSGLIREHQILLAQWRTLVLESTGRVNHTKREAAERLASWAYLLAIVESCFPYARNETNTIESGVDTGQILSLIERKWRHEINSEIIQAARLYARTFATRFTMPD